MTDSSSSSVRPLVGLQIVCLAPPDPRAAHSEFGLQERTKDSDWKIHPGRRDPLGHHAFDLQVGLRAPSRVAPPDFFGTFVHGKPGERFLYLSWRPVGWHPSQAEPPAPLCVRRMKIPLRSISWSLLDQVANTGGLLRARVEGSAHDGRPNAGSVDLLPPGWEVIAPAPEVRPAP